MDKFVKLGQDMVLLWSKYKVMYWAGIWNTLKLAFLATLIGCFIGLLCGVLNTIPYTKKDPLPKRFLLKLLRIIIRVYVEVFRGTPMVLQRPPVRQYFRRRASDRGHQYRRVHGGIRPGRHHFH